MGEKSPWRARKRYKGDRGSDTRSDRICFELATGIRGIHLQCWSQGRWHVLGMGGNTVGQLGNGTTGALYVPTEIGSDTNWKFISAGSGHTVGVRTDGTLWVWGNYSYGTPISNASPAQVGNATTWASVSTNGKVSDYTQAIMNDGTLWSWGYNADGTLGDGTTVNKTVPTKIQ